MAERIVNIRLRADASGFSQGMSQAQSSVDGLTRKVASSARSQRAEWSTIGTGLVAVGAAITGIGLAAAKTGIEYNTLQQTSRAALTTLLGSAKAANAQMDKLDEFARTSPFAKQVFIEAQQGMLAFGIEAKNVIPYLDAIQNAVAAAGGSNNDIAELAEIFGKISASSKITAIDLQQFGRRGINAAELIGEAMGFTGAEIREQITAGTLDADAALEALATGMATRFAGASERVKETFAGAMDRVKAAWRDFSAELAKPLVDPEGGGALVDLLNWTADMMRRFEALPEPVKHTTTAVVGLAGAGTLLLGSAMLVVPKIVEFNDALKTLNITGARAQGVLASIAPAMGAIAAAQLSTNITRWIDDFRGVRVEGSEVVRVLKETGDATEALDKALAGGNAMGKLIGDSQYAVDNLRAMNTWVGRVGATFQDTWAGHAISAMTGGLGRELAIARDNLEELDRTMAAHVASGDVDTAAELYGALAVRLEEAGYSQEDIVRVLPEYTAAQEAANAAAEEGAEAQELSAGAAARASSEYMSLADSAAEAWKEVDSLIDSMMYFTNVGRDVERANARVQQTLADVAEHIQNAKDGVAGYSLSLDANTVEGSKNRAMLADMAADLENAARKTFEHEKNTLDAATAAENFRGNMEEARKKLIDTGKQFNATEQDVTDFINEIHRVPDDVDIDVLINTAQAERDIQYFIDRNTGRTIRFDGVMTFAGGQNASALLRAHGGTVGYARGGTIPGAARGMTIGLGGGVAAGTVFGRGTAKSDSVLVRLSRGEEVIQEPYASANRDLLKAINRGDFHQGMVQPQVVIQPAAPVSLDGLSITGRLEIGGDGLARIIDGRVSSAFAGGSRTSLYRDLGY